MLTVAVCDGVIDASGVCSGTVAGYPYIQPFDATAIDPLVMVEAFSAGFIITGSVMLVVWSMRQFVKPFLIKRGFF